MNAWRVRIKELEADFAKLESINKRGQEINQDWVTECEMKEAYIDDLKKELDALKFKNAELREALEPFAKAGKTLLQYWEKLCRPGHEIWSMGKTYILVGDCLRAKEALETK